MISSVKSCVGLLKLLISRPFARSQSLTVLSSLPEASMSPFGENETDVTEFECPMRVRSSCPLATSQSLTVRSLLAEAKMSPFGEKEIAVTRSVCPLSVRISCPLATSQSLMVLSQLAEASILPVRREHHRGNYPDGMATQGVDVAPARDLPELHSTVEIAGR